MKLPPLTQILKTCDQFYLWQIIMCYVIQRTDVDAFQTSDLDLEYKEAVRLAHKAGVEIITMVVEWNRDGEAHFVRDDLPFVL